MKSPKERAKELVKKHYAIITSQPFIEQAVIDKNSIAYFKAKQCALICVDETIKELNVFLKDVNLDVGTNAVAYVAIKELNEVKKELQKSQ